LCRKTKTVSEFNKYNDPTAPLTGWRYYSRCKKCNRRLCAEYGRTHREQRNARLRAWRKKNPDAAKEKDRRGRYMAKYGLTLAQVARLKAAKRNRCWICAEKKRLFIDHCHKTKRVRGALCASCNTFLGRIESNSRIVAGLSKYLEIANS
jgi:hypothetical protein